VSEEPPTYNVREQSQRADEEAMTQALINRYATAFNEPDEEKRGNLLDQLMVDLMSFGFDRFTTTTELKEAREHSWEHGGDDWMTGHERDAQ